MYLCRTMTGASLQNIAALLSKKDHTTIIHGVDKIAEKLTTAITLLNNDIMVNTLS